MDPRTKYERAYRKLKADLDAGRISAQDASVKFAAMLGTYRQEKEAARFSAFLRNHGLDFIAEQGAR